MRRFALLLATAILVPACGGGGGGGAGGGGPAARLPFRKAHGANSSVLEVLALPGGGAYVAGLFTHYENAQVGRILRIDASGNQDPAFASGIGFNSNVLAMAPAADGSGDLYVGGLFTSYNGTPCGRLVRLNADGTRDLAFASPVFASGNLRGMAAATDGSGDLFICGSFPGSIMRVNPNGTQDAGFTVAAGFDATAECMAVAADGDVYVCGSFTLYQGVSCNRIVRINSDGTRDAAAFDVGTGFNAATFALTLHAPSGDIYVGGDFTSYKGTTINGVARLNSDGALDAGFAIGAGSSGRIDAIAFDSEGRVVLGGNFLAFDGQDSRCLVRLTPGGAVDRAFPEATGFFGSVTSIAAVQDATGDIIAGGNFTWYAGQGFNRLVRIRPAGEPAPGFMSGAAFTTNVLAAEPAGDGTGDVYFGGSFVGYNGTHHERLTRLTPDGTVRPGFVPRDVLGGSVLALCSSGDATGDVYAGGTFTQYDGGAVGLVRINANGSRDTSFDPGTGFNGPVHAIMRAADGSGDIYAGGDFTSYRGVTADRIVRINADGTFDPGFASGIVDAAVRAILPAGDGTGDVYIAGDFITVGGVSRPRIARLNANGSLDPGFAVGSGFDARVWSLERVEGSDQVYVAGEFSTYDGQTATCTVRLNGNGARDAGFAVTLPGIGFRLRATLDGTGDLYVSANTSAQFHRVNADGSTDTAFDTGDGFWDGFVETIALVQPGEIIVAGSFTVYGDRVVSGVARLFADGRLDE